MSEQEGRYTCDTVGLRRAQIVSLVRELEYQRNAHRASAETMRASLLALAERLEKPMTGMSNMDVAKELRRVAG